MKTLLAVTFILVLLNTNGQTIKGRVVEAGSDKAVAYASIGLVGRNIGTIANEYGGFELPVHAQYYDDTILVSMVGYYPLKLAVRDFAKQISPSVKPIMLHPQPTKLKEAIIVSDNYVEQRVGNKAGIVSVRFLEGDSTHLGLELGTLMWTGNKKGFIKDVNFAIAKSKFDSMMIMVNIYNASNGLPGETILHEPVIITTGIKKGVWTVDLKKYHIYVEEDFFVSLTWIKNFGGKGLELTGVINGSPSYSRVTAAGEWEKLPLKLSFYSTLLTEKN